jgi:hypothetical protein
MTPKEEIRKIANELNEQGYPCCRCMNCKTCKMAEQIYEARLEESLKREDK